MIRRWDIPTALQHLERTTAECLVNTRIDRVPNCPDISCFPDLIRLSCLDGAASNPRYLRNLPCDGLNWSDISVTCEDHGVYAIAKSLGLLNDADIRGQTQWTLASNHPMARHHCGPLIRDIVADWINVRRGPPPASARERSRCLLRVALAGESKSFEKQFIMIYFPNGDPAGIFSY